MSEKAGARTAAVDPFRTNAGLADAPKSPVRASGTAHDDAGASTLGFQPVQAALYISQPGDPFEQEAERAVGHLLADAKTPFLLRRTAAPALTPLPRWRMQAKSTASSGAPAQPVGGGLRDRVQSLQHGGQSLPPATRSFFRDRFQFDFDSVRIHTGHDAAEATRQAGARAFTTGRHIVFNHNEYAPETQAGVKLLGHELAHVVQQSGLRDGSRGPIFRQAVPGQADPTAKAAADIAVPPLVDPATPGAKPETEGKDKPGDGKDDRKAGSAAGSKADSKGAEGKAAKADKPDKLDKPDKAGKSEKTDKADKAEKAEDDKAAEGKKAEPKNLGDISSSDLATIDEELAEHQRWAGALATVGTAGSDDRARFVVASALMGEAGGFGSGAVEGAKVGLITRGVEFGAKKGGAKLAAQMATKFGTQAAKVTPLPAVGAVIGGVMSAIDLIGRDWSKTGETIGRWGQGEGYEKTANQLAAVSEVIDIATAVLNVIAGVIGVIAIASWAIAIATLGVASPLSATLTSIALGIGIATLILDAINAVVIKQLIVVYRALHAFTSQADPSDVMAQGKQIEQAAETASGFLGGFAGGMAASHVGKGKPKVPPAEHTPPKGDHPPPAPAAGDGPHATATKPIEGAPPVAVEGKPAAGALDAKAAAPVETKGTTPPSDAAATKTGDTASPAADQPKKSAKTLEQWREEKARAEVSFEGLNDVVSEMHEGPFGQRLEQAAQTAQQPPPTAPPGTRWGRSGYRLLRRMLRQEGPQPQGAQAQHRTKWLASTRDLPPSERMTPAMISENRTWLQTDPNRPATKLLFDPQGGGTRYFTDYDRAASVGPQLGLPGIEPRMDPRYTTEHRFADRFLQNEARRKIIQRNPEGIFINRNLLNLWAGAEEGFVTEGHPGRGDWGWQPSPLGGGQVSMFPGEPGPRPAAPSVVDPRQTTLDFNKPVENPNQVGLFDQLVRTRVAAQPESVAAPAPSALTESPQQPSQKVRVSDVEPDHVTLDELRDAENAAKQAGLHKAVAGGHAGRAGSEGHEEKRQAGFWNNLESAYQDETAGMTSAQAALSVAAAPGAMFAHWAAGQASEGYAKAQAEPVYEHVNPQYPAPPGTVQDHIDIQNQLLDILQARAQSELAAGVANQEETKHKAHQEPIKKGEKAAKDAMTATEAHKKVVERRQEANKKSADKETESKSTIDDYAARSSQLTAITGPLRLFERFTYLATYLPDDPHVLVGVKNSIGKVHTDADKFLKALDNVDGKMKAQKAEQPQRAESIKNDGTKLGETNDKAVKSNENLDQTKKGAEVLGKENDANVQAAGAMKKDAQNSAASLGAQANQKQAQSQSMAAAWQSWAVRHREARLAAMKATEERMLKLGYTNVKTSER